MINQIKQILFKGYVPLHEAAYRGYTECCKRLLEFKAAHLPRTRSDEVPSDLARKSGHYSCARFLGGYFCHSFSC